MTTLLANDVLARVERMRLTPSRRFTNRSRGEHSAGRGGSSTDFADYRNYVEGDDVRFVDWNIFARVNRPYLKQYHQEEELHVVLMVDASASMGFEGKLICAGALAAALGVMGLMGNERVSCRILNAGAGRDGGLVPGTGRARIRSLFGVLERIEPGGDTPVERGIEDVLRVHRGRGMAVILSDFLTFGDPARAFNLLYSAGLEPYGLQVLGPTDRDPALGGDARLVDAETGETLDVTADGDLVELYQTYRAEHESRLATLCRARGGRFLSVPSTESIEQVLFDSLPRAGWVR